MSAPHVSGVAALVLDRNKHLSLADLTKLLLDTSTPLGNELEYGHGLVNADAAIKALEGLNTN
ncbi:hypothetical protein GCM10008018_19750 [Paenibacillus marchantiophytorum]|uniref:Peptidase S8/S53 domain-containing protein n=2 Tax=Paenibacillus marchantiophytorum TaxID=1619310 RepID=A0ABQ2BUV8_9BACL|nr:hypothetical protein GCM10008018_19750 [Paenibacillus marchantiophytorum]